MTDPFQLVLTWRAIHQLKTLTATERTQIRDAVHQQRDAIRLAPSDAAQLAAATVLLANVERILRPAQRAAVIQALKARPVDGPVPQRAPDREAGQGVTDSRAMTQTSRDGSCSWFEVSSRRRPDCPQRP
jgi:hypothetical protein